MVRLRIGFDAKRLFCNKEGLGSYARTLLMDMQSLYPEYEYHLYTPVINKEIDTQYFFDKSKFVVHMPSVSSMLWRYSGIAKDIRRDKIDVYIGLSNELPRSIDKSLTKTVVVIHDLFYKHYPKQFSFVDRMIIDHKFHHAITVSDSVIAASKHTARDIHNIIPSAKSKTQVVYQSANKIFRENKSTVADETFILCVGTINDRKNLKLLVKSYGHLDDADRLPVKIVGDGRRYKNELEAMIKQGGYEPYFEILGFVSNQKLAQLYRDAKILVFPSKYEGFGIPILESLHAGTPVITSNSSSLPEVVGHHGIVIDYSDDVALADAIKLIISSNEKGSYIKNLDKHLEQFSPEQICNQYISIIQGLSTSIKN